MSTERKCLMGLPSGMCVCCRRNRNARAASRSSTSFFALQTRHGVKCDVGSFRNESLALLNAKQQAVGSKAAKRCSQSTCLQDLRRLCAAPHHSSCSQSLRRQRRRVGPAATQRTKHAAAALPGTVHAYASVACACQALVHLAFSYARRRNASPTQCLYAQNAQRSRELQRFSGQSADPSETFMHNTRDGARFRTKKLNVTS